MKTDLILKALCFDVEEDIAKIKRKISFYHWIVSQYEILLTIYDDPNIKELISITNKEREKIEQKVVNLAEIKLFERGGDIKTSIGIGFGNFASDYKNNFANKILNKAHGMLDSYGLSSYVDFHIARSVAWKGVYEVLMGAKNQNIYNIEEDDFLWANDYPDEMIGIRYSTSMPF
ncbi:MAG TPA: hypothetical protein PLI56_07460 [Exilispira sp.]|nr:hypothetical protein [Exilispira sp.]